MALGVFSISEQKKQSADYFLLLLPGRKVLAEELAKINGTKLMK